MTTVKEKNPIELTIRLGKITKGDSWRWKAYKGIKRIKKHIQKYFNTECEVKLAPTLNSAVWGMGMRKVPKRIRVRAERVPDNRDSSKTVVKLSYVAVGGFKGLGTEVVPE